MKTITGLLLSTIVLALAACGGDDGLSKAEYVEQLNKICRDGNAQLAKIPEPTSLDDLPGYVEKAKKVTSSGVDKMADLEPPEDLKADHDAQVADGRKVVKLADDLAAAAKAGDQAEFQRLSAEGDRMDTASDDRAKRLGATECADEA